MLFAEKSISKRPRIQDAAVALSHEQGMEVTFVNEIVRHVNIAKGTFYVYYKGKKGSISQILTKQHGCLMNDILNHSYEAVPANSTCWKRTFVDELITYCIQHPKLLRTVQKNAASILDTKEHRDMVFIHIGRMPDFPKLLGRGQGTGKKALNHLLMMIEITEFVCYNVTFFGQLGSIEKILPKLRETMFKMPERKEQPMTYRLGINVGSTALKAVVLNDQDETVYKSYERHKSKVRGMSVSKLEESYELLQGQRITLAITSSVGLGIADDVGPPLVQEVFATAQAVRRYYPASDVVIELGGEDAKIISLQGTLEKRMNSTYAGGTGMFIDQMVTLPDVDLETVDQLSLQHTTLYPIVLRCNVLVKSDIQPLINQGCEKSNLAASTFQTIIDQGIARLTQGRNIEGSVSFPGDPLHFLKGLQERFKETLKLRDQEANLPELAPYPVAPGNAIYTADEAMDFSCGELPEKMEAMAAKKTQTQGLPLLFESDEDYEEFRRRHTSASVERSDIHTYRGNAYLGIDAGSTTTKLALIDKQCHVLYESYVENMGNPVGVVQKGLVKLYALMEDRIHIIRSAVTSCGEEPMKHAFHLDIGVVEMIACYRATHYFNPQVDFIIDIGDQDTKCFRIRDRMTGDILLNEAYSSDCGSFIETFAKSMGYDIERFARMGLSGKRSVDLGTCCVVFMNSSVRQAQRNGASMEDIPTGLRVSVTKDALYKAIYAKSPNDTGKQIVVQGGTSLNDTVLRSFELELERNAIHPSISHLMGAYGAVSIAKKKEATASSLLKKEDTGSFTYNSKAFHCTFCTNHYNLTVNTFAGRAKHIVDNGCERPMTGKVNKGELSNLYDYKYDELLELKGVSGTRGKIGIPLVLNLYNNLPFWYFFFTDLGYEIILSDRSSKTLYSPGQYTIPSDTICYPAKLMRGHVQSFTDKGLQTIFYPCMTYDVNEDMGGNHLNCPVVAYYLEVVEGNMNLEYVRFLCPYVYLRDKHIFDQEMFEYFKTRQTDILLKGTQAASNHAYFTYRRFKDRMQEEGRDAIALTRRSHYDIIVLVGRPCHVSPQINHGICRLSNNLGFVVISKDSIAKQAMLPSVRVSNQWIFHSRVYSVAQYVMQQEHMELIQLVNSGRGIDAITTDEVKDILRSNGKLYAQVKIDEADNLGAMKVRCRSLQAAMEEREG